MSKATKPTRPTRSAPAKSLAGKAAAAKPGARERRLGLFDPAAHAPAAARKQALSLREALPAEAYKAPATLTGYVSYLRTATPLQRVAAEREGVPAQVVKHMASSMDVPAVRMFKIIGIAKATAENKAAQDARIGGASGQAALALMKLLCIAEAIVEDGSAEGAAGFDTAKWLGRWIEQPQAALGGQRPADLLDTPTGYDVVARLLGSLASGAYQ